MIAHGTAGASSLHHPPHPSQDPFPPFVRDGTTVPGPLLPAGVVPTSPAGRRIALTRRPGPRAHHRRQPHVTAGGGLAAFALSQCRAARLAPRRDLLPHPGLGRAGQGIPRPARPDHDARRLAPAPGPAPLAARPAPPARTGCTPILQVAGISLRLSECGAAGRRPVRLCPSGCGGAARFFPAVAGFLTGSARRRCWPLLVLTSACRRA
jgi:hypothetical protein